MSSLSEQIEYGISQFRSIPNITDVQVEDPSDLIKAQINNEPSLVFVLTVHTYVSVIPAIIKFVAPISVIMTSGPLNVPADTLISLAHNIVLKPIDNFIQDHSFNDNLTDTAFTLYIDPIPDTPNLKLFRPILLRGVNIDEYQGGDDYNNLVSLMKQQPYVMNAHSNIVVDPKLIPDKSQTFLAFSIETDIPLMHALPKSERPTIMTDTISFMLIVNMVDLENSDDIIRQLNERIEEYQ
jgi:hypothetical protein